MPRRFLPDLTRGRLARQVQRAESESSAQAPRNQPPSTAHVAVARFVHQLTRTKNYTAAPSVAALIADGKLSLTQALAEHPSASRKTRERWARAAAVAPTPPAEAEQP